MQKIDLWTLRQQFEDANIQICFNGPLSHSIIEELGLAVKRYLENETPGSDRMMDVFSVYIEQTQNVRNYARQKVDAGGDATRFNAITLLIGRDGDRYLVSSGNLVDTVDIPALTGKIDYLRTLDAAGLKAYYKEERRKPRKEDSLGAGLGLIDMARKTSQPLEYQLQPVDEQKVFFNLKAVV